MDPGMLWVLLFKLPTGMKFWKGKQKNQETHIMTKTTKCSELGVKDCDAVISGETAGDVVAEVVDHLRAEHDIDMPDADIILKGKVTEDPLDVVDPAVALVVERLTEALNLSPLERPTVPGPSIGRTTPR
jgi:predicted small metal-binding protein